MTMFLAALALAAPPDTRFPQRWEFRDAATLDGRPLLTYRPVELADRTPRPVHPDDAPPAGARFGFLAIGNHPDLYRALVWLPSVANGPEIWLDRNGDGRFDGEERHRVDNPPKEIAVTIGLRAGGFTRYVSRTLLIRPTADGGLRYAVRGYAAGRLALGGREYAALLTDANADGCFDSPGTDRVWIDLDNDGRFAGSTEQFAVGAPVAIGGRTFLVKPSADGSAVSVRERPADQGTLKLALSGRQGQRALGLSAQLVGDAGELVALPPSGRPAPMPVGRYSLEALSFRMLDEDGRTWGYRFVGERRFDIVIERGRDTAARPLEQLTLTAAAKVPPSGVGPGQELPVTPTLRSASGLELVQCDVSAKEDAPAGNVEAEIRLEDASGQIAGRGLAGFQLGRFGTHAVRVPTAATAALTASL